MNWISWIAVRPNGEIVSKGRTVGLPEVDPEQEIEIITLDGDIQNIGELYFKDDILVMRPSLDLPERVILKPNIPWSASLPENTEVVFQGDSQGKTNIIEVEFDEGEFAVQLLPPFPYLSHDITFVVENET